MNQIPHEFAISGIYMPPLLASSLLGAGAAVVTAHILNYFRLSRFFFFPPLVFLALTVIYTVFFDVILIPF